MPVKNVELTIVSPSGSPLSEQGEPVTVRSVVVNCLLSSDEGKPSGVQKADRYRLAMRVHAGGDVDLTPEELSLVKQVVGVSYVPLVVGQVYAWADQ